MEAVFLLPVQREAALATFGFSKWDRGRYFRAE